MALAIAAIGECMIELSGRESDTWRMGYAGDTFNTLWTLRALAPPGQKVDYVSAFGDDPFSVGQIAFLVGNGIGIADSPVIAGARPGLYAITLTGAERSFTYWRSDAAARQLARDPAALEKSLQDRALVYFSGITLAILDAGARTTLLRALAEARAGGARIAFDPNYRPRLWPDVRTARDAVTRALGVVDIALPTFPDEQALYADETPHDTIARIAAEGVGEIVVKNGESDAIVARGDARQSAPAIHVARPVDTTGAGDSFNGAYLAARLAGDEPAHAALRAHRVAAAVIQVSGALASPATLDAAFHP